LPSARLWKTAAVARPIWSGTISFGLVSVPVRMFTATSSQELRRLRRAKFRGMGVFA
jgi:non-homologous end joining protein Ku